MVLRGLPLFPLLLTQRLLLAAGGFQFGDLLELDEAHVSTQQSASAAASQIMEASFAFVTAITARRYSIRQHGPCTGAL